MAVPGVLRIYPGDTNRLLARVGRDGFEGPVTLEAINPPLGVEIGPVTVPSDEDEAAIEVTVAKDVSPGKHTVRVRGSGPEASHPLADFGAFELQIEPPPALIRLAVPPKLAVLQGGTGRFTVRIARSNVDEPLQLSLVKPPAGLTAAVVSVPAGADQAQFTLTAARDVAVGSQPLQILAQREEGNGLPRTTADMKLDVQPAVLRIAAPTELAVLQGSKARFAVRLARSHANRPVKLNLVKLPAGVTAPEIHVPAGADTASIEMLVSRAAAAARSRSSSRRRAICPAARSRKPPTSNSTYGPRSCTSPCRRR